MEIVADTLVSREMEELLAQLVRQRFWGALEVSFQDGQPLLIRKTQTIKLGSGNRRNHRGELDDCKP